MRSAHLLALAYGLGSPPGPRSLAGPVEKLGSVDRAPRGHLRVAGRGGGPGGDPPAGAPVPAGAFAEYLAGRLADPGDEDLLKCPVGPTKEPFSTDRLFDPGRGRVLGLPTPRKVSSLLYQDG